ncbi:hypothetical protein JKP88DRAFT_348056 [Tribonema minus]|uniref:Uncharacterized protein n=1 Tax=Tribonema minus TaxID=303371 RepID=A0A835Z5J6_9STRA|nr:hypothetical protein JKP88DRAFT_348056 [Tribonema minus]
MGFSKCIGALSLLLCTSSSNAVPHAELKVADEVHSRSGSDVHFKKLAAKGDRYTVKDKTVHMSIEKGDVNGSNICSGNFVAMSVRLERFSYDSSEPDNSFSGSSVRVSFDKGTYRDCTDAELSTTSLSYSSSNPCCSNTTSLYGYENIDSGVGTFKLGLTSQNLITAKATVTVPLYDSSSSSTSSSGTSPPPVKAATAKVTLKIDCTDSLNYQVTLTGDRCVRGDCVSSSAEQNDYWCTTKLDGAALTGTIGVQGKGLNQPKIDLANLPAGYTLVARTDFYTEDGKTIA